MFRPYTVRTKRALKRRIRRLRRSQTPARVLELQQSLHFARRSYGLMKLGNWGRGLEDPTRVHTLTLLKMHGDLTATEVEAALEISQVAVSHQMAVLQETGFVRARRRGKWTHYELNRKAAGLLPNVQPRPVPAEGRVALPPVLLERMNRLTGGKGLARANELRGSLETLRGEEKALISRVQAHALANRTRLMMLALINMHEDDRLTATELAVVFHLTHVAVGQHLRALKRAGLVVSTPHPRPPSAAANPTLAGTAGDGNTWKTPGNPSGRPPRGKWVYYSASPGIARMLPRRTVG